MVITKVLLVGGPEHLPGSVRVQEVSDLQDKVKVAYGAGYEHFSNSGEMSLVNGEHLPVFRWCGKTRFAE
ncbi:DUF5988 family protein [Actinomadura welshii]